MTPSGDIERRLRDHIQGKVKDPSKREVPFYVVVRAPGKVTIAEQAVAGEAKVECSLPSESLCIQWNFHGGFPFLKVDKNADGALLIQRNDGTHEAHVMECKRTVDQTKWSEILQQMRWTLSKLMALAGALGVHLDRAVFYTAFRNDRLSTVSSPNPIFAKLPIETDAPAEIVRDIGRARQLQIDWENDDISLGDFEGRFAHRKIELDGDGNGAIGLV